MSLSRITTRPTWSLQLSEINNIMYAVKTLYIPITLFIQHMTDYANAAVIIAAICWNPVKQIYRSACHMRLTHPRGVDSCVVRSRCVYSQRGPFLFLRTPSCPSRSRLRPVHICDVTIVQNVCSATSQKCVSLRDSWHDMPITDTVKRTTPASDTHFCRFLYITNNGESLSVIRNLKKQSAAAGRGGHWNPHWQFDYEVKICLFRSHCTVASCVTYRLIS